MFPRGLVQPAAGYRFCADALLLACFPDVRRVRRAVDLGAGCGVVGLGLLLRRPQQLPDIRSDMRVDGLELQPELAACAVENAQRLGLADRLDVRVADVRQAQDRPAAGYDLAVANPPYHRAGSGRASPMAGRRLAAMEGGAELADFLAAGRRLLAPGGRLAVVLRAGRLDELLAGLRAMDMPPKRLRLVHGREGRPALLALVEACKGGRPGLLVEPALVLSDGRGPTAQALAFCPFLECNRRPCSSA